MSLHREDRNRLYKLTHGPHIYSLLKIERLALLTLQLREVSEARGYADTLRIPGCGRYRSGAPDTGGPLPDLRDGRARLGYPFTSYNTGPPSGHPVHGLTGLAGSELGLRNIGDLAICKFT
ncbi:uncharacterized protein CLUP02_08055 [Colletotrichum lupini]|uniref:Uncharacterized protein n=1 Tax=Colletotrichum lupini TaxID=145971 RepID=A0A9Q8WGN6_9PEZI|nr:uncharacterized protein CLUP02_08055 [Colletotrichum lupini]UQC82566.1 hypothetical protein CLUP02_08055 [Colletotrichum lupini]